MSAIAFGAVAKSAVSPRRIGKRSLTIQEEPVRPKLTLLLSCLDDLELPRLVDLLAVHDNVLGECSVVESQPLVQLESAPKIESSARRDFETRTGRTLTRRQRQRGSRSRPWLPSTHLGDPAGAGPNESNSSESHRSRAPAIETTSATSSSVERRTSNVERRALNKITHCIAEPFEPLKSCDGV